MLELAQAKDREAVDALARQAQDLHAAWRPDRFSQADCLYPQAQFEKAIAEKALYVAKLHGKVVGYALVPIVQVDVPGQVKRRVMQIQELCVDEDCRGQGIGKAMMVDILALARAFCCRDLELQVYQQNQQALEFYRCCGFQIRSVAMSRPV